MLCGKKPSWAHFLDDCPSCKATNSGGESHLGLHSPQEWASVVSDSSVIISARSWAGLEGRFCGDPAILGRLIWLLGLGCPDPGQWRSLHYFQGLCMALQEGGWGPRKRLPWPAGPQATDGEWFGTEGRGAISVAWWRLGSGTCCLPAGLVCALQWSTPNQPIQILPHPADPLKPGEE